MAAERQPLLLAGVRPVDFEVLEDGKNVFASPVSTLESSPSSPEPASLPAEDLSTNFNGPKPAEVMPDDDREGIFADSDGHPAFLTLICDEQKQCEKAT